MKWKIVCAYENKALDDFVFTIESPPEELYLRIAEELSDYQNVRENISDLGIFLPIKIEDEYASLCYLKNNLFRYIAVSPIDDLEDITREVKFAMIDLMDNVLRDYKEKEERRERRLYEELKKKYG